MCLNSLVAVMISAVCAVSSLPVAAQAAPDDGTRAAARDLARQGIDAYLAEKYPEASDSLEKAYRLFATPTLGLWSARALRQRGRWVESAERLRETLRLPASMGDTAIQKSALQDAEAELDALQARLPAITIKLVGTNAKGVMLDLDHASIPTALLGVRRPMNPGEHRVTAVRGKERGEVHVELAEKEHKVVEVRLALPVTTKPAVPVAAAAPERGALQLAAASPSAGEAALHDRGDFPARPVAIATLALGGAALVASGVTALIANAECSAGKCATESAQSIYDPMRSVSVISFWGGAALAVGGALTWWLAPARPAPRTGEVTWAVGPLGLQVFGAL